MKNIIKSKYSLYIKRKLYPITMNYISFFLLKKKYMTVKITRNKIQKKINSYQNIFLYLICLFRGVNNVSTNDLTLFHLVEDFW